MKQTWNVASSCTGQWAVTYSQLRPVATVDLEIFVVKIFSWFAQTTKIKNTKYILQRIIIIAITILVAQFRSTAS